MGGSSVFNVSRGSLAQLGTGVGGMVHVLAAALGLSLLIAQSAWAFNMVKYVGAAYLLFLGVRLLLSKETTSPLAPVSAQGTRRAFLEGITVEMLNVKTALFFLAFLPQFVSPSQPLAGQLALLGTICVVLNTLVDVVAVFAANRLLQSSSARVARARLMTRISGATMVGLGAFLALARRE